jgi:hypothetical protein
LNRFSTISCAEYSFHPFCPEKQQLDAIERSGVKLTVPKSIPVKGQKLYSDPWDVNVREVSRYHEETERRKAEEWKARQYQQQLKALPQVDYYPTTKLKELQYKKQLAKIENELEKMQSGTTGREGGVSRDDNDNEEENEMEEYSQTINPSALNHLGFSEEFQANTAEESQRSPKGGNDEDEEEEEANNIKNSSNSHPNSFYKYASRQTIQEEEDGRGGEEEEEDQERERRDKEQQQPSSSSLRLDHLQSQQPPNHFASPSSTLSLFSSASQQQKVNRKMKKTVIKFGQPTAVKDTSSVLSLHAVKTIPTIPSSTSASQKKNNSSSSSSSYLEKLEKEYPAWSNNEFENKKLLSLAKQGDQQILYEQNIAKYLEEYQMTSRLKNSSATLQLMPDPIVPSARVPSRQSSPKGGGGGGSRMGSAMNSPSFNNQQSSQQQQQQNKMNYYYYNEAEEEQEEIE